MVHDRAYELQADEIVRTLARHGVRYVLIGGFAAITHGSPFPTEDIDITPDRDLDDLGRLWAALTELQARIRTDAVPGGLPVSHDAESLRAGGDEVRGCRHVLRAGRHHRLREPRA